MSPEADDDVLNVFVGYISVVACVLVTIMYHPMIQLIVSSLSMDVCSSDHSVCDCPAVRIDSCYAATVTACVSDLRG